MQVGTPASLERLFLEPRFNGWCVGEIHIVDSRIVPNCRRATSNRDHICANLENHVGAIARQISSRRRTASYLLGDT